MGKTKAKAPKQATAEALGLFVQCAGVLFQSKHRALLEVSRCRNDAYHVRCPTCGESRFFWGETWRATALTADDARGPRGLGALVFPSFGRTKKGVAT